MNQVIVKGVIRKETSLKATRLECGTQSLKSDTQQFINVLIQDSLVEDCRVSVDVLKRIAMRMPQEDPVLTQQITGMYIQSKICYVSLATSNSHKEPSA